LQNELEFNFHCLFFGQAVVLGLCCKSLFFAFLFPSSLLSLPFPSMTLIRINDPIAHSTDSHSHRRDEAEDTKTKTKTAPSSLDTAGGSTLIGDFELDDLSRDGRSRRRSRRHPPQSRRATHRPDDDAMKFSHSIQFNAVPDWSTHYIAYSNLKKLYVELGESETKMRS
jgi:hypothetical protein